MDGGGRNRFSRGNSGFVVTVHMAEIARGVDDVADSALELFRFLSCLSLAEFFSHQELIQGKRGRDIPGNPPSAFRSQRRCVWMAIGSAVSAV